MLKLIGQSMIFTKIAYLKLALQKKLVHYKEKNSTFTLEKPGRYHLSQVTKLTSSANNMLMSCTLL